MSSVDEPEEVPLLDVSEIAELARYGTEALRAARRTALQGG